MQICRYANLQIVNAQLQKCLAGGRATLEAYHLHICTFAYQHIRSPSYNNYTFFEQGQLLNKNPDIKSGFLFYGRFVVSTLFDPGCSGFSITGGGGLAFFFISSIILNSW